MAIDLPYLSSYKNVPTLFERITTAKQPEAFTHKFLQDSIGLKGKGDRALIALLRMLGFVDASGKPTPTYSSLKNPKLAKKALAAAIRDAYKPLFDANERAHEISSDDLKGLISQVAGTEVAMTAKILGTLSALIKLADFSDSADVPAANPHDLPPLEKQGPDELHGPVLRPEFHYNIQVHLPSNASEETYLNIFNAMRKVF